MILNDVNTASFLKIPSARYCAGLALLYLHILKTENMKQKLFLLGFVCAVFLLAAPATVKAQNDPFYYESISNPSKTINFIIGVYHTKNEFITRDDGTGYTKMRMAVINKEGANPFTWSDYKIYIMLKNGDLFYNYTTKAQDGDLACNWTVQPGQNHIQYVCFDKAFDVNQIERVWLGMSDNKFFDLVKSDK